MSTILAAGLTPAWQQIIKINGLQTGEVNRAESVSWCASGKIINVAIALHHLGASVKTVSLIGGITGNQIREEFAQTGIPARWIETPSPTRVCTTVLDIDSGSTTELVENSSAISASELESFHTALDIEKTNCNVMVLSGSLPPETPKSFYKDAIAGFEGKVVLDIRGPELMEALSARPLVIKPNREELEKTVDQKLTTEEDVCAAMRSLNHKGAKWVVVSQGSGIVLATTSSETYRFHPNQVDKPVNPIGCGDCLAAGIAWGISQGNSIPAAISLGIASAQQNLTQLLPARVDPVETRKLADSIKVDKAPQTD